MLSVLIPCYNYNIVPLVQEIHKQCSASLVEFEILVFDDASKSNFKIQNRAINSLENCSFRELKENIGRSKIRNLLAKEAKFENLIFLDCDTLPKNDNFINRYIEHFDLNVIYGGISQTVNKPPKPFRLRWLFTKKREQKAECSSNFFIKKSIILQNLFDESINKYGYEDVLFFKSLENNNITVNSIKNPVIHLDNESALEFIKKVEISLNTLNELVIDKKISRRDSKIYNYYQSLSFWRLNWIPTIVFKLSKNQMLKNFSSSQPSLLLFDLYRLGYFCTLKSKL
ncbi:glycosyltransferase [Winogradskyella sp. SYSU M77433]|uniref:glycosyltransferase family 2 protein n=1 Tax=Winogradskyella sp. SYSU M77433 TaxID=3042722 RepID=UPI00248033C1|nr:glycosyltransferase [Winogradskyella sp. SYSU M77433]MDH7913173.1 glycosyltransferase [Winogradskyella sp. SYSU M77433]